MSNSLFYIVNHWHIGCRKCQGQPNTECKRLFEKTFSLFFFLTQNPLVVAVYSVYTEPRHFGRGSDCVKKKFCLIKDLEEWTSVHCKRNKHTLNNNGSNVSLFIWVMRMLKCCSCYQNDRLMCLGLVSGHWYSIHINLIHKDLCSRNQHKNYLHCWYNRQHPCELAMTNVQRTYNKHKHKKKEHESRERTFSDKLIVILCDHLNNDLFFQDFLSPKYFKNDIGKS